MNLDDLDTLVMDADPALDVVIPSAWSAEAHWVYLQLTGAAPEPRTRHGRVRLAAGVVGIAVVALVAFLVAVVPGPTGSQSAAAAVLTQAAASAAVQNSHLAPGQYMYTELKTLYQVSLYSRVGATVRAVQGATCPVHPS